MADRDYIIATEQTLDPTHQLISSRRVEGTRVCNAQNQRVGSVHSVMIEKSSGRIAYALLSFGGFLGIAGRVHAVPWDVLAYDVDLDAYRVDISAEQLRNGPTLSLDDADRPRDQAFEEDLSRHYDTMRWWGL